jgi:isocitrate dehydrogenase kinase/phosphatase
MLQDKTAAELYTMVGLQKAARISSTALPASSAHSRDRFIIAPGIRACDERSRCRPIRTYSR